MTRNMGTVDRIVRAVIGIAALTVAILGSLTTTWTWVLVAVAAVALATAAVGFCPLYALFGTRTDRPPRTQQKV